MPSVAEAELKQIPIRTSSLYKEAERLVFECRDRHDWCRLCRRKKECRQIFDRLNPKDPYTLPISHFKTFRRELSRLEEEGFTSAKQPSRAITK